VAHRRADIAMSPEDVHGLLSAGRTLILVTTGPDGLPDPVPMWYLVGPDGLPVMRTYAKSQKVVNLRRDPRAVALVEDGERYNELRGVQLTGRIELDDDSEAVLDVVMGLGRKYEGLAPADEAAAREALRDYAAKQVVMRLVPDRIVSWDHRKQGVGAAQ
jgi:PPOX class probable F420-dependent enzyme